MIYYKESDFDVELEEDPYLFSEAMSDSTSCYNAMKYEIESMVNN